jgi:hypothetical protein
LRKKQTIEKMTELIAVLLPLYLPQSSILITQKMMQEKFMMKANKAKAKRSIS